MAHVQLTLKNGEVVEFSDTFNDDLDFIADNDNIPEGETPSTHTRRRNTYKESLREPIGGGFTRSWTTEDGVTISEVRNATIEGYDEDGVYQVINGTEVVSVNLFDAPED